MVEDTATTLAFGEPPGQYHFDQQNMLCHLYGVPGTALILREGRCHFFLYSKLRWATESTVKSVEVPVYCICRMPEQGIECSGCKK